MHKLIITNNSSSTYQFAKAAGGLRPKIAAGATYARTVTRQQVDAWGADLQALFADSDFEIAHFDFERGILRSRGAVVIEDGYAIGEDVPFSQVVVQGGTLQINDGVSFKTANIYLSGNLDVAGASDVVIGSGVVEGDVTLDGTSSVELNGVKIHGTLTVDEASLDARDVHIGSAAALNASSTADMHNCYFHNNLVCSNTVTAVSLVNCTVMGTFTKGSGSVTVDDTPTDLTP